MARPQSPPHFERPKIELQRLTLMQVRDIARVLYVDTLPDFVARYLESVIAITDTCRPLGKGFTPRVMAAEHQRTLKHLSRGLVDYVWQKIQDPSRIDYASHTRLEPLLAARPSADELRRTIETCQQELVAWPGTKPQWEAVKLAVIFLAPIWVFAWPPVRGDKRCQRLFILAGLEACGFRTDGLRKNPRRLDRDEVIGPVLAQFRQKPDDLVRMLMDWLSWAERG
jgi:hypothetical protein